MNAETKTDPWDDLEGPSTRTPRSLETRDRDTRARVWSPPTMLPDPQPQDGYVFKWVRVSSRGVDDKINYQKRLREGWEAVRAEDHPEMLMDIGVAQQTGQVEVGGLVLCKMPQEMVDQRTRYYQNRTSAEMESAEENYLREDHEHMRKVRERSRKTVFGR